MRKPLAAAIALLIILLPIVGLADSVFSLYYTEPEYKLYATPATENRLEGTMLKISGEIVKEHKHQNHLAWIIEQADGNRWVVFLEGMGRKDAVGKQAEIYGYYAGLSWSYKDLPSIYSLRYAVCEPTYSSENGQMLAEQFEGRGQMEIRASLRRESMKVRKAAVSSVDRTTQARKKSTSSVRNLSQSTEDVNMIQPILDADAVQSVPQAPTVDELLASATLPYTMYVEDDEPVPAAGPEALPQVPITISSGAYISMGAPEEKPEPEEDPSDPMVLADKIMKAILGS